MGLIGPLGWGLTRLGFSLLAGASRIAPVAVLEVRGWLCPAAAWEVGIDPERLVVVRCSDRRRWVAVTAALLEGIRAVYAEVPVGVSDQDLRRLGALARARRVGLALRPLGGDLPDGMAHLSLRARGVVWEGTEGGHGRLTSRRLLVEASGKGVGGMVRRVMLEDEGADSMRVVPRLVALEREDGREGTG